MAKEKIVLAYSGGLDTSVILKWLKETYDAEIIAFTADIGQKEELDGLEEKALATGASKVYIDDLRDEFASDFIYPMFQSGALYEGQYLLGTSIARPLIAKRMVDIAIAEGARLSRTARQERERPSPFRAWRSCIGSEHQGDCTLASGRVPQSIPRSCGNDRLCGS